MHVTENSMKEMSWKQAHLSHATPYPLKVTVKFFSLCLSVSLSQIIDYIHKYIKGCLVVLIDTWEFFIIKRLSLLIVFLFSYDKDFPSRQQCMLVAIHGGEGITFSSMLGTLVIGLFVCHT